MDENELGKEYCRRCGMEVFPFSRKYSESKEDYFCVKCAEKYDAEYLVKHSCAMCQRLLKKDELKMVLPSKSFGDKPRELVDRIACLQCYTKLLNKARDRRPVRNSIDQIRNNIRRVLARRMAQRAPAPAVVN